MKSTMLGLSLLLCSFGLQASQSCLRHTHEAEVESKVLMKAQAFSAAEDEYVEPYGILTNHLAVKPMSIKGFNKASVIKLNKSFEALEAVVNSEEFKNRVINFKSTEGKREFKSNKGLTNEQIYAQFMEGRENLQPDTPYEMNLFLKLYNRPFSRVIGWTNPTINTINVNWKFFKKNQAQSVASNLAHEWMHKLGFDHKSAAEHDSAPYAIGYIVRELGERYLNGGELR